MTVKPETLEKLRHVSVATLCTQLFKRGFRNVFIQGIARLTKPSGGNMVGPAFTMRNIPSREDLDVISVFEDPEHPQRKAIEIVPPGFVLVLDCRGETRAASGGQILTTRLKIRGAAGLVSDGPVRDSGAIAAIAPLSRTGPSETSPAAPRILRRIVRICPPEAARVSPRQSSTRT